MNKPVAKKQAIKKTTLTNTSVKKTTSSTSKLRESQESVKIRKITSELASLDQKSIEKILSNASVNSQTVFDAVMTVAAESTPGVPKSEPMPWRPLVDTFINNRYFAEESARLTKLRNQALLTKEFRTLIIGGCRQTGKTQLAKDIVFDNPKARLIHAPYSSLIPKETDPVLVLRTISTIDDLRNDSAHKDIELLVINQESFPMEKSNPYKTLLDCMEEASNDFPLNMQVIWIL